MKELLPGVYAIRSRIPFMPTNYLLVEGRDAVLIDAGILPYARPFERALRQLGLEWENLAAILLTHGHLDHVGALGAIRQRCDAPIYAHPADLDPIAGRYPYRGWVRICAGMEIAGRALLRIPSVEIDYAIGNGDWLPYFGGLQVIHLPGHTAGHCGYYAPRHDLLFSGDFFANWWGRGHIPPFYLNNAPDEFPRSRARLRELAPSRVLPNHCASLDPEMQAKVLMTMVDGPGYPNESHPLPEPRRSRRTAA